MGQRLTPDTLRPRDLTRTAVWEFTNEEISHGDELSLRPIEALPVNSLNNRLVGVRVRLSDGSETWALLGNVSLTDPRATRHFLTASVWCGDRWFPLARYHDVARDKFGPVQLARALRKEISEIFPITYDIGSVAKGESQVLRGAIEAEPQEKLSRSELIRLAVSLG